MTATVTTAAPDERLTVASAIPLISALLDIDSPVWAWGAPGIGKSDIVNEIARQRGADCIDIRLSAFDPVDLRGLPAIVDGLTEWIRPKIWPAMSATRPAYIFFDEMDRAAPAVANAALQIVLNKRIGEHVFPDSTRILAAGNGKTDRRGTNAISGAQANRFTHLYLKPDADASIAYWETSGAPAVLPAFIAYRPLLIHRECAPVTVQKQTVATHEEHAFESPRAWSTVGKMLQLPDTMRGHAIRGTVGKAAGDEFEAFFRVWRALPPIADIIRDPAGSDVPRDPATMFAVAFALARKMDFGNIGNCMTFLQRCPVEFLVAAVTNATARNPSLKQCSAYVQYAARYQHFA